MASASASSTHPFTELVDWNPSIPETTFSKAFLMLLRSQNTVIPSSNVAFPVGSHNVPLVSR